MKHKRIPALLLALTMTLSLAACKGDGPSSPSQSPSDIPSAAPSATLSAPPSAAPSPTVVPTAEPLRLGLVDDLTSMGTVQLLSDSDSLGEESPYRWTLSGEDALRSGLLSGTLDVAVLSPAGALELYHTTGGQIKILAAVAADGQPERDILSALKAPQSGSDWNPDYRPIIAAVAASDSLIGLRAEEIAAFLANYNLSLTQAAGDPEQCGQRMAELGMASDAALAARAVTQCLPVLLTGREMAADLTIYYEVLFQTDPASVAGGLPDDGIYALF